MKRCQHLFPVLLIISSSWAAADPAPTTHPGAVGSDVKITIDTTQAPDLADWAHNTLLPTLQHWYPIIAAELPIDGHPPAKSFEIVFDNNYKGVAATAGTHIVANPAWFRTEIGREAVGALVHEEVHVVQFPFHNLHGHHMPSWLLEGSADYIRWFQFEPPNLRPHPRPKTARYDASYRITAAFLQWVISHYDKNIVTQMNTANFFGTYSSDLWIKYTGKTVEQLGDEWKASLQPRASTTQ